MGWGIDLRKDGKIVQVPAHQSGSNICIGGDDEATCTVTYNYSPLFRFGMLAEKTGKESIPILEEVVEKYGTTPDDNYWDCTEGNVGHMASILLGWARLHPDAVWDVD